MVDQLPDSLIEQLLQSVGPTLLLLSRRFRDALTAAVEYQWWTEGRLLAPIRLGHLPRLAELGFRVSPEVWFDLLLRPSTRKMARAVLERSMVQLTPIQLAAVSHLDYLLGDEYVDAVARTVQAPYPQHLLPVRAEDRLRELTTDDLDTIHLSRWFTLLWQGAPLVRGVRFPLSTTLKLARRPTEGDIPNYFDFLTTLNDVLPWGPVPARWREYVWDLGREFSTGGNLLLDLIDRRSKLLSVVNRGQGPTVEAVVGELFPNLTLGQRVESALSYLSRLEFVPVPLARWLLAHHRHLASYQQPQMLLPLVAHYDREVGSAAVTAFQRCEYVRERSVREAVASIPSRRSLVPATRPAVDRLYALLGPTESWQFLVNWDTLIAMAVKQTRWHIYHRREDLWFRPFTPWAGQLGDGRVVVSKLVRGDAEEEVEYIAELGLVMALDRLLEHHLMPSQYANRLYGLPTTIIHRHLGRSGYQGSKSLVVLTQLPGGEARSVVLESFVYPKPQLE